MTVITRAERSARLRPAPIVRRIVGAPVIGLAAGTVVFIGAGTPSYWGDEAASVMSATRPLSSLVAELGQIDAVHGAYYLFLHFWVRLVGTSELAVRFPSSVAAGLAVAGTVVLGRLLFDRTVGVIAGVVLAVIPQLTRMGIEARSYAFGIAAAVWITVLFVRLMRSGSVRRWAWAAYAVALAACIHLFLYLGLLIVVHAAAVLAVRPAGAQLRRWVAAVAVGLALSSPMILIALAERGQIAFLARRDYATVHSVLIGQWFGSWQFAAVAWTFVLVGAAVAGRSVIRRTPGILGGTLVLAWAVVPTAALMLASALLSPMYNLRYTAFSLPAVAILMAVGTVALARRLSSRGPRLVVISAMLVTLVALAAPGYIAQRQPFAKDGGSDLRQTAEFIATNADPGDAVVFDESVKPSRRPRLAIDLYPTAFDAVDDIALRKRYTYRAALWDSTTPLAELGTELAAHDDVWAVELSGSASTDVSVLESHGFRLIGSTTVNRTVVSHLVKE